MPVNPIDYGRYGNREMVAVFEEEFRHNLWLKIEAAVAKAQAELDMIPTEAAEDIARKARPEFVTLERTMEIESKTRHDVAALFEAIAEKCEGEGARWVHFGLTSNDIKDTALGLQLKQAYSILLPHIDDLCRELGRKAQEHQDLVAVGRSHGQHAVPITYGLRFTVWLDEILRHRERVDTASKRASVGKIAGATGSHAAMGPKGIEVQKRVLEELGLHTPIATTQIIQRDRHAESILTLANLCASLDKIATDFRTLQRTEISETYEPFKSGEQVGSSAMPHKRNPVTTEKICGLARVVRSLAAPALENVISWEERDISHSSTERFIIPQAFILADYLVTEMTRVIKGLTIDKEAVEKNLNLSQGQILSEYIVTTLTQQGLERPKAHETLREISENSREKGIGLLEALTEVSEVTEYLKDVDISLDAYYDMIRKNSHTIVKSAFDKMHKVLSSHTK